MLLGSDSSHNKTHHRHLLLSLLFHRQISWRLCLVLHTWYIPLSSTLSSWTLVPSTAAPTFFSRSPVTLCGQIQCPPFHLYCTCLLSCTHHSFSPKTPSRWPLYYHNFYLLGLEGNSSSQLWVILPPQGHWWRLETFLTVTTRGEDGISRVQWAEARGMATYRIVRRAAPSSPNKDLSDPNVTAEVEKLRDKGPTNDGQWTKSSPLTFSKWSFTGTRPSLFVYGLSTAAPPANIQLKSRDTDRTACKAWNISPWTFSRNRLPRCEAASFGRGGGTNTLHSFVSSWREMEKKPSDFEDKRTWWITIAHIETVSCNEHNFSS